MVGRFLIGSTPPFDICWHLRWMNPAATKPPTSTGVACWFWYVLTTLIIHQPSFTICWSSHCYENVWILNSCVVVKCHSFIMFVLHVFLGLLPIKINHHHWLLLVMNYRNYKLSTVIISHQIQLWSLVGCLSWTIMNYHRLSWTIWTIMNQTKSWFYVSVFFESFINHFLLIGGYRGWLWRTSGSSTLPAAGARASMATTLPT